MLLTGPTLSNEELKSMLLSGIPDFWTNLQSRSFSAKTFDDLSFLTNLRKKAIGKGMKPPSGCKQIRLALIGGYNFCPFSDLVLHLIELSDLSCHLMVGKFDNYMAEISDPTSELYSFAPDVVVLIPSEQRCRYTRTLDANCDDVREAIYATSHDILALCKAVHEGTGAELILTNFILPAYFDPGSYRQRVLWSDWNFKKSVNLEIGLRAPSYVHLCDLEFLSARRGTLASRDERRWFESKQLAAPDLLVDIAQEVSHLVRFTRQPRKKVLVVDLDNTLWGGIIGDDGLAGIEIGDTSPRGEAFKAFQKFLVALTERGILLAVCSKNDASRAIEPFEKHPEMVLRMQHVASFKANWEPKSDNIRSIATDLNLGLDSFVFVDDNPMEIEIVRQFLPEVATILLGEDPSRFVPLIKDSRLFEVERLTTEDIERTSTYQKYAAHRENLSSITDMPAFLKSLKMQAAFRDFDRLDVPRISQLINKSNQFNLTTIRRTESEVEALMKDPQFVGFTIRLSDKFVNHGLVCVLIGKISGEIFEIDTWLMSCRVLNRGLEQETMKEVVRLAELRKCNCIVGAYIPTTKNELVQNLLPSMGLILIKDENGVRTFQMNCSDFTPQETQIEVTTKMYE